LVVERVRVGKITVGRIEVETDPLAIWKRHTGGHGGPQLRTFRAVAVELPDYGRAASIELERPGGGRIHIAVNGVEGRHGDAHWSARELVADVEHDRLTHAIVGGARLWHNDRAGTRAMIDSISASLDAAGDLFTLRAAARGLSADGTVRLAGARPDLASLKLSATLERLPLGPILAALRRTPPSIAGAEEPSASGGVFVDGKDITLDVTADALAVRERAIAAWPFVIPRAHLAGRVRAEGGVLHSDAFRISVGDAAFDLVGDVGPGRFDATLRLDKTPCAAVLRALPPAAVPALDGLAVDGQMAGRIHAASTQADAALDVQLDVGCHVLHDPALAEVEALRGPVTARATDTDGNPRPLVLGPSNPRFRVLTALKPEVVAAFPAAEDAHFYTHHGFDVEMIRRALAADFAQGRIDRGASTISQQVIKNLFLSGERTWARKLEEAVLTWRLEQRIDKARILELYVNLVELGPGIYGIAEGADRYFGKEPEELTTDEAAQLAALLPAPRRGMDAAWRDRYSSLKPRLERRVGSTRSKRVGISRKFM
jgi:hypothetical protein